MLRSFFISVLLFFCGGLLFSQDHIYLNNGSKFDGIVTEIGPTSIKYKSVSNPDGPSYVISRSEVLLIEYKNGGAEIINKNPVSVSPEKTKPVVQEKKEEPENIYYSSKNTFMINGLALANADATFLYERDLANNHLGLTVLGGYNFNKTVTWPNALIKAAWNDARKNYDIGLGINFYPSTRRRSQYFVGLLFKYMSYSYNREVVVEEVINGFIYERIELQPAQSYQLASMIVNGVQIRITPSINYKLFAAVGGFNAKDDLQKFYQSQNGSASASGTSSASQTVTLPKMYLGMCLGIRF